MLTTLADSRIRLTCSLCGYSSRRRWKFIIVAGQYVCRNLALCKGQSQK